MAGIATRAAITDGAATEGTAADHRAVDTIHAKALLVAADHAAVAVVVAGPQVEAAGLQAVVMKAEAMRRQARVDTNNTTKVKVVVE